jgi:hypothetical protein
VKKARTIQLAIQNMGQWTIALDARVGVFATQQLLLSPYKADKRPLMTDLIGYPCSLNNSNDFGPTTIAYFQKITILGLFPYINQFNSASSG